MNASPVANAQRASKARKAWECMEKRAWRENDVLLFATQRTTPRSREQTADGPAASQNRGGEIGVTS